MNKTVEKAMEINSRENYPELEIGDVVTLGEVWDGNGDNPIANGFGGCASYWVENNTYLQYELQLAEPRIFTENEDEDLQIKVKIVDIYIN